MIRSILGATAGGLAIVAFAALWLQAMPVKAGECGKASFYAEAHQGRTMANGRPFNMNAMTAASNSLPLGSRARVTSGKRSVVVTITDRGGFGKYGRILDMSKASFARLANPAKGVIRVCVTKL
jgi:rare lipoprotein A